MTRALCIEEACTHDRAGASACSSLVCTTKQRLQVAQMAERERKDIDLKQLQTEAAEWRGRAAATGAAQQANVQAARRPLRLAVQCETDVRD